MTERVDLEELKALLGSLDKARLSDNGVVIYRHQLAALIAELTELRRERADWDAIGAWLGTDDERDCHIGPSAVSHATWTCRLVTRVLHGSVFNADDMDTRAEAVSAAAEWCRKQREATDG